MKDRIIHERAADFTVARLNNLKTITGKSKGGVIADALFIYEKIQLAKSGRLSLGGLLTGIDFTIGTDFYSDYIRDDEPGTPKGIRLLEFTEGNPIDPPDEK
jgi:hypothetical protein